MVVLWLSYGLSRASGRTQARPSGQARSRQGELGGASFGRRAISLGVGGGANSCNIVWTMVLEYCASVGRSLLMQWYLVAMVA